MIKNLIIIVKIITFIGMVLSPFAYMVMRKEKLYAMERAKDISEAMEISKKYTYSFIKMYLLFAIPAFILLIVLNFY